MRNLVILGISILCGLIAFFLTNSYFKEREKQLGLLGKKERIVVTKKAIAPGEPLNETNLEYEEIPGLYLKKEGGRYQVVTDREAVQVIRGGYRAAVPMDRGQPLRWIYIDTGGKKLSQTFSNTVPDTYRGVTIPVDLTSGVAGLLVPNDNVDILATFQFPQDRQDLTLATVTMTILQNVRLLAVGNNYSHFVSGLQRGTGYSTVTLAVTPKEAELLVFAQQKGKLSLSLRNPEDVRFEKDIQRVDFQYLKENVEKYLRERERRSKIGQ